MCKTKNWATNYNNEVTLAFVNGISIEAPNVPRPTDMQQEAREDSVQVCLFNNPMVTSYANTCMLQNWETATRKDTNSQEASDLGPNGFFSCVWRTERNRTECKARYIRLDDTNPIIIHLNFHQRRTKSKR